MTGRAKTCQESAPNRRKALVCIGSPAICMIEERDSSAPRQDYPTWTETLREQAKANVINYATVPGRVPITGGNMNELTGGDVFSATSNFSPAVIRVLNDLSNY